MNTNEQSNGVKTFCYGKLIPVQVSKVVPELEEIYRSSFDICGQIEWAEEYLQRGQTNRLTILYKKNEVVGFSCSAVEVAKKNGRIYAIFNACVYTKLHQKAGARLALSGLLQALKYKILHPHHSVVYVTDATSPASYCLIAELAHRCFPSPNDLSPAYVAELFGIYTKKRKAIRMNGNEYVIRFPYFRKLKDVSKVVCSKRLRKSMYYKFYLSKNPDYSKGYTLLMLVPLDVVDVFLGVVNCLLRLMRNRIIYQFRQIKIFEKISDYYSDTANGS